MEILRIRWEEQLYKVWLDKSFIIDKKSKFLIKRFFGGSIKSEIIPKQQFAELFHKQIIRKFEKRKVYSSFKDNI